MNLKNIFQILSLFTSIVIFSSQELSLIQEQGFSNENQNFFAGLPAEIILDITDYLKNPRNFLNTHKFDAQQNKANSQKNTMHELIQNQCFKKHFYDLIEDFVVTERYSDCILNGHSWDKIHSTICEVMHLKGNFQDLARDLYNDFHTEKNIEKYLMLVNSKGLDPRNSFLKQLSCMYFDNELEEKVCSKIIYKIDDKYHILSSEDDFILNSISESEFSIGTIDESIINDTSVIDALTSEKALLLKIFCSSDYFRSHHQNAVFGKLLSRRYGNDNFLHWILFGDLELEAIKKIIEESRKYINRVNASLEAPLHSIMNEMFRNNEMLSIGDNPYADQLQEKYRSIVKLLIDYGANTQKKDINGIVPKESFSLLEIQDN